MLTKLYSTRAEILQWRLRRNQLLNFAKCFHYKVHVIAQLVFKENEFVLKHEKYKLGNECDNCFNCVDIVYAISYLNGM